MFKALANIFSGNQDTDTVTACLGDTTEFAYGDIVIDHADGSYTYENNEDRAWGFFGSGDVHADRHGTHDHDPIIVVEEKGGFWGSWNW